MSADWYISYMDWSRELYLVHLMVKGFENLITTRQAAKALRIDPSLVRRFFRDGRLPGYRVGNQILFDRAEVAKFNKIPRKRGNPGKGAI